MRNGGLLRSDALTQCIFTPLTQEICFITSLNGCLWPLSAVCQEWDRSSLFRWKGASFFGVWSSFTRKASPLRGEESASWCHESASVQLEFCLQFHKARRSASKSHFNIFHNLSPAWHWNFEPIHDQDFTRARSWLPLCCCLSADAQLRGKEWWWWGGVGGRGGEGGVVCQRAHRGTFPFWRSTRKSPRNENSFINGGGSEIKWAGSVCNPGSGGRGGSDGSENSLRKSRNFTKSSSRLMYFSFKILLIYTHLYLKLYNKKVLFTSGTGEKCHKAQILKNKTAKTDWLERSWCPL